MVLIGELDSVCLAFGVVVRRLHETEQLGSSATWLAFSMARLLLFRVDLLGSGFQGFPEMFAAEETGQAIFEDGLDPFAVGETPHAFAFAVIGDREHHALLEFN